MSLVSGANAVVAIKFVKTQTVTVNATGQGSVTFGTTPTDGENSATCTFTALDTSCTRTFDAGSTITLSASPAGGYRFGTWTSGCNEGTTCDVSLVDGTDAIVAVALALIVLIADEARWSWILPESLSTGMSKALAQHQTLQQRRHIAERCEACRK